MDEPEDLDADIENADWVKTTWDLPPYKSPDFMSLVPPDQLDSFRKTPAYAAGVASGLICDDEWVGDYVGTD